MPDKRAKTEKRLEKNDKAMLKNITEDAFNDFYRSRVKIYRVNFFRGLFFGVGSFLGATVVVAALIAFLNLFTDIPAGIGDFFRLIVDALQSN